MSYNIKQDFYIIEKLELEFLKNDKYSRAYTPVDILESSLFFDKLMEDKVIGVMKLKLNYSRTTIKKSVKTNSDEVKYTLSGTAKGKKSPHITSVYFYKDFQNKEICFGDLGKDIDNFMLMFEITSKILKIYVIEGENAKDNNHVKTLFLNNAIPYKKDCVGV